MTHSLTWRPELHLPGVTIRIADVNQPLSAHDSWRATLAGHLYLLVGTGTTPETRKRLTGYAGVTEDQTSGRPWVSLTHWVRNAGAINIDTIALVTLEDPDPDPDVLRILECTVIRTLNLGCYMLNTVTGARAAARALGATARLHSARGLFLATVLRHHVMRGRTNPLLSPASTLRETAVKVVLAAGDTALDTAEVLAGVDAVLDGRGFAGSTQGATARRDLSIRETANGQPRVLSGHVPGGLCVYWARSTPRQIAIANYLARQRSRAA